MAVRVIEHMSGGIAVTWEHKKIVIWDFPGLKYIVKS